VPVVELPAVATVVVTATAVPVVELPAVATVVVMIEFYKE
jgi:hypothetical protein